MGNTKITSHQLFCLTAFFTCGTSIIYVSSSLAGFAKQDAWISAAITPAFGLLFIWLYSYLGVLYPGKTFVEIICTVFGKWFGGCVTAAFVFLCFIDVPQITWYVGNFFQTQTLTETPVVVTNTLLIIALIIALFYGIEAIARSSEIYMYVVSFMIMMTLVLVSPKIKADNLVPVFEEGIAPVLKGSLLLISYTTWPLISLNMIYPSCLDNIKAARRAHLLGYLWGSAIIFLVTITAILVIGNSIAAISVFPTYLLAQEISIGAVISRLEAIVSTAWFITLFFKALLYFYGGVISLSQLLGLKDYRRIILPFGLVFLVLSVVVYPNSIYEAEWDKFTWIPLIATFSVFLPIMLLLVIMIKRRGANERCISAGRMNK